MKAAGSWTQGRDPAGCKAVPKYKLKRKKGAGRQVAGRFIGWKVAYRPEVISEITNYVSLEYSGQCSCVRPKVV